MCEGSFLPSSFGPHQKHTEFESSLRSYPIHSCVFCKGGYLEIRPAVDGLGSQGPWYPPFENHKGWGSLQSGRDPKGGPARHVDVIMTGSWDWCRKRVGLRLC